jgi:uncharacterized protein YndB with AHSA1/START domain/GNAT superfamily N-acetyltransferase
MSELRHVADIEVGAPPDRVWNAIVDPELSRRYYYGCAFHGDLRPGSAWSYRFGNGQPAIAGTVLEAEAPRRLRLTARFLFDPNASQDPEFRISWELEPRPGGRTLLRLAHDEFPSENMSYHLSDTLPQILLGVRVVVDPEAAAAIERRPTIGPIEVRPLTPERLDDYLDFFDHRAFLDNPVWGACYCFESRVPTAEEELYRTADQNRSAMSELIAGGRVHGLLAYDGHRAIGWCSAAPRTELPALGRRPWITEPEPRLGAIHCLLIAPAYRRHGVARALVRQAVDYLADLDCTVAEAYPPKRLDADAVGFWGPLDVYRELGFETFRDELNRVIVRRRLDDR